MSAAVYDCGRDTFLERASSKPPSKFDSIEYLDTASSWKGKGSPSTSGGSRRATSAAGGFNNAGTSVCGSNVSNHSSNATTVGAWSWGGGSNSRATEVTHPASSWKEEVSGRRSNKPSTAPSSSSSCRHRKKFYWGPRVTCQGQETDRDVRSTNMGEPVTFALCVSVRSPPVQSMCFRSGPILNIQRIQRMPGPCAYIFEQRP